MPKDTDYILDRALCPPELFLDDYTTFVSARARLLCEAAKALCELEDFDAKNFFAGRTDL
jgi:hypothetical protein